MPVTITRADLVEAVRRAAPVSGLEAADLLDQVIETICTALESGEDVRLSSFATFALADKAERIGRNPKTGIEAVITARRVISFKASRGLKDRVTAGGRARTTAKGGSLR